MHLALQQAKLVQHKYAEVPIGAVVVRNITINAIEQQSFEILSQAGNQVETKVDASAHAEYWRCNKLLVAFAIGDC